MRQTSGRLKNSHGSVDGRRLFTGCGGGVSFDGQKQIAKKSTDIFEEVGVGDVGARATAGERWAHLSAFKAELAGSWLASGQWDLKNPKPRA